jgi:hypothetical protein
MIVRTSINPAARALAETGGTVCTWLDLFSVGRSEDGVGVGLGTADVAVEDGVLA